MKNKQNLLGCMIFDEESRYLNLSLKNAEEGRKTGDAISSEMMKIVNDAPCSDLLKEKLAYIVSDSARNQMNVSHSSYSKIVHLVYFNIL